MQSIPGTDKIIYISLTNGAGGAEQILLMAARVTESKVIFLKKVNSVAIPINENINKAIFLSKTSIFIGFIILLKELSNYRKNHIIISSHPYLNAYLGFLKRVGFLNSQLVTRESTSVFLRFTGLKRLSYRLVYYLGYPAIDLLICQTLEMKAQLITNLKFLKKDRVIVLKNPVDLGFIANNSDISIMDPMLKQDYICSAGRLIALKGFDLLISSFSILSKEYPELKLLILGEGEERKNLQDLIINSGLQNKVFMKGFVSNPFPYFKQARVCVVSSIREGFPNVLLQMMALNSSVVSTLCAEGIEEFDTISKVKVGDQPALINAIQYEMGFSRLSNDNKNLKFLYERKPEDFIHDILRML